MGLLGKGAKKTNQPPKASATWPVNETGYRRGETPVDAVRKATSRPILLIPPLYTQPVQLHMVFSGVGHAVDKPHLTLKARVYYSYSVIRNLTPLPRRPLEPSKSSVGMPVT